MADDAAVVISHVTKAYRQGGGLVRVLDDISLKLEHGASMAIVGRNGSGKTTLLRILARLSPPTTGKVVLRGRVAPMLGLASGFFQGELSGRKNVRLVGKFFGVPDEVIDRRMDEVAAFAGLERQMDDRVRSYSRGQIARLAFSITLNLEPHILLADGGLTVGDSGFREQCLQRVEQATREGMSVLLATHDADLAQRVCRNAAWLSEGAIAALGQTDVVFREYEREEGRGRKRRDSGGATPEKRQNFNDHVALLSGSVFSMDGIEVDTLDMEEDALMTMTLETATPNVDVRCVITLATEGRWVRLVQPENVAVAEPGRYVASVHVPAGTLPPGRYRGRLGCWLTIAGREYPVVRPNALRLETYDPREPDDDMLDDGDDDIAIRDDDRQREIVELTDLAWKLEAERRK